MTLKVIGAGLGRTGTNSLQLALQQLWGGPCYHMIEVITDPEVKVQQWMDAMDGNADWDTIMKGYVASLDWPAAAFWRELADKYPDACKAAYEMHNAEVRATIAADRLIDWQPGGGWEPICAKLGVSVPSDPFPHANTTDDFRTMLGLESTG